MLSRLKGSRTVLFNVAIALYGAILVLQPDAGLPSAEEVGQSLEEVYGHLMVLVGVANVLLRSITDSPVFSGLRGDK